MREDEILIEEGDREIAALSRSWERLKKILEMGAPAAIVSNEIAIAERHASAVLDAMRKLAREAGLSGEAEAE